MRKQEIMEVLRRYYKLQDTHLTLQKAYIKLQKQATKQKDENIKLLKKLEKLITAYSKFKADFENAIIKRRRRKKQ